MRRKREKKLINYMIFEITRPRRLGQFGVKNDSHTSTPKDLVVAESDSEAVNKYCDKNNVKSTFHKEYVACRVDPFWLFTRHYNLHNMRVQ